MNIAAQISEAISYDPDTGEFRWKISPSAAVKAGHIAGSRAKRGYWQIAYRRANYQAHRVAWLLMTGSWPSGLIDHANCDPSDNRWVNLRLATPEQNCANRRAVGPLPKGVTLHRQTGRYQAQIRARGKRHYLGLFDTPEQANKAYARAAKALFGEFARAA